VHAELRRQLGTSLTLIDLFKHPTIHGLAQAIAAPPMNLASPPGAQDRAALQRDAINRQRELARQRASGARR
jgi:hypothetical protein